MSCLLNFSHNFHNESYNSLDSFGGRNLTLVGSDSLHSGIAVHKHVLIAFSDHLKEMLDGIPISELDTIMLPDISDSTLQLLTNLLYYGYLQCTKAQYDELLELMHLLYLDSTELCLSDADGNHIQFDNHAISVHDLHEIIVHDLHETSDNSIAVSKSDIVKSNLHSITFGPSASNSSNEPLTSLCSPLSHAEHKTIQTSNCKDLAAMDIVGDNPDDEVELRTTAADECQDILFSCLKCDKSFSSDAFLQAHITSTRNKSCGDIHFFHCRICRFKTTNQADCRKHNRTVHADLFIYQCEFCPKKFMVKGHLREHLITRHNPDPFKCNMCDYTSGRKHIIATHVSVVHLNAKPYACHICGKCFKRPYHLTSHMNLYHTDQS